MLLFSFLSVASAENYPVDVCFMAADLKYNAKDGVKICEIQHGSLSVFKGDKFRNPDDPSITDEFLRHLSSYHEKGHVVSMGMTSTSILSVLNQAPGWRTRDHLDEMLTDPDFLANARNVPNDPHDISSYSGFLYSCWSPLLSQETFEAKYPGVVVIDKSSFPFWIDKYKMTTLFLANERLASSKPKWGNYPKKYSLHLAEQIISDLQCDTFVIKPRGAFLGNGVIIVEKENLDETLKYILRVSGNLAESKDQAYNYWMSDRFDTFLVEEFIASDLITLPHLENRSYQPTMRVAVLLVYNKKCYEVHFLGSFWKTPELAIEEEGSFMKKHKSSSRLAIRCPVDPEIMNKVKVELRVALPLLHEQMLKYKECNHTR